MANMAWKKVILQMLHLLYDVASGIAVTPNTKCILCLLETDKFFKQTGSPLRMDSSQKDKSRLPDGPGIERQWQCIVTTQDQWEERHIETSRIIPKR